MAHASLVPSLDSDIHLVLCRFGRAGLAYVETDPMEADETTVVRNLLYGQYREPLRVVALNVEEGWSRDVSELTRSSRSLGRMTWNSPTAHSHSSKPIPKRHCSRLCPFGKPGRQQHAGPTKPAAFDCYAARSTFSFSRWGAMASPWDSSYQKE